MAVVAHHPVIVHGEGVAVGGLSVDKDLAVLDLQVVKFVGMDDALVKGQVFQVEWYGLAFVWNLNGAEIIHVPGIEVGTVWEDFVVDSFAGGGDIPFDRGDERKLAELLGHFLADEEDGLVGVGAFVGFADMIFVEHALGDAVACGGGDVTELHVFGLEAFLVVYIDNAIDDLEFVAGHADEAFHIILAFVHGMCDDFAEVIGVVPDPFASVFADEVIITDAALEFVAHGVARGIVEHNRVVAFDGGGAGVAVIRQLDPLEI